VKTRRVQVQWTETAAAMLGTLPLKVRRGILDKADQLLGSDPRKAHKALVGEVSGYYSLKYSHYRALYSVDETPQSDGSTILVVTVTFVAAGNRKDGDKRDIYELASRLVKHGIVPTSQAPPPTQFPN